LTKKQTFVDLGCGNGFLVYLLSCEGYIGYGIDLTKRKIWDKYKEEGKQIDLRVEQFDPSKVIIQNVDWIIGNHPDELAPWIPLIASKSYNTRWFLLPCCLHDFSGKFTKKYSRQSRYESYLNYLKDIGRKCGFVVDMETLKIPSTKNHSLIARKKNIFRRRQRIHQKN